MDNSELEQRAAAAHALIVGSSESTAWRRAATGESGIPPWQHEVVARVLTLTYDQDIQYLSTAMPDDEDWDVVVFTATTIVRVVVVRDAGTVSRIESFVFPRSSLESLELLDVAPIEDDSSQWPTELTLLGHYRAASITLPMDKFASSDNKRDLRRLLASLLEDLVH